MVARSLDKKHIKTTSPEPLVGIKNNCRNVPRNALCQNLTNGSAPLNKKTARALVKKYLIMTSPSGRMVRIQNNLTEMILIMPSAKMEDGHEL